MTYSVTKVISTVERTRLVLMRDCGVPAVLPKPGDTLEVFSVDDPYEGIVQLLERLEPRLLDALAMRVEARITAKMAEDVDDAEDEPVANPYVEGNGFGASAV